MKASIIIPTKNPGPIFKKVMQAVLEQQAPWPWDVLVIDSGSNDGTIEYCKTLQNIKLHCIKPEEYGHGKTRNLGISMTTGEYAVMLTHDAMPADKSWLVNLIAAAESDPNVAGAFGRHLPYDNASIFMKRDLQLVFDGYRDFGALVKMEDPERYKHDRVYKQVLHFFSDNNSALRRSVWEKIPYPNVEFAEDQLWAREIIEKGYTKAYADNACVYHSHNFGLVDTFRRSFDESHAFLNYFGYDLCPSIPEFFARVAYTSLRDVKYALKQRAVFSAIRAPFENLLKLAGHYLGQRSSRLPEWLVDRISRDRSMKLGKLSA